MVAKPPNNDYHGRMPNLNLLAHAKKLFQTESHLTTPQRRAMLELMAWIMLEDKKADPEEMEFIQKEFPDLPLMEALHNLCHIEEGQEAAHLALLSRRLETAKARQQALALCHAMTHVDGEFHPKEAPLLAKIEACLTA